MDQRKESEWTYLGKILLKNTESAESGVRRIKKNDKSAHPTGEVGYQQNLLGVGFHFHKKQYSTEKCFRCVCVYYCRTCYKAVCGGG
jgi:hypothetical protein